MTSDSGFILPEQYSHEWQNIRLLQQRRNNIVYIGERYGRRFLLKALHQDCAQLTEYRLQQEKEFRLGIALSHPNIAATYSLEEVPEIGRCIVQEWIDGQTLGEWLQEHPSKYARKRACEQLMEALAYLHANQRVHHDLKPSNILITRNGRNIKLIDFGLSDSDDSVCTVEQDARDDIRQLACIIQRLFPHRYRSLVRRCAQRNYPNITALQNAWKRRQRVWRLLPPIFSIILLLIASFFFYMAYQARHAEQRKQEEMMLRVNEAFAKYAEGVCAAIERINTFREASITLSQIAQEGWLTRDSLINLYPEKDPIRVIVFDYWTQQDALLQTELIQQAQSKPMQ